MGSKSFYNIFDGKLIRHPTTGGGGASGTRIYNEQPSGTIDGVNKVFNLANSAIIGSEEVHKNGIKQRPTVDYTISGTTITFTTVAPKAAPVEPDTIEVSYDPA